MMKMSRADRMQLLIRGTTSELINTLIALQLCIQILFEREE